MNTLRIDESGAVTIPAELVGRVFAAGDEIEVHVDEDAGTMTLEEPVDDDDAWAYLPDNIARMEKALESVKNGRLLRMSHEELLHLAE